MWWEKMWYSLNRIALFECLYLQVDGNEFSNFDVFIDYINSVPVDFLFDATDFI